MELKKFQQDTVNKLLSFIAPEYGLNDLIIKAPTGSGKLLCFYPGWMNMFSLQVIM